MYVYSKLYAAENMLNDYGILILLLAIDYRIEQNDKKLCKNNAIILINARSSNLDPNALRSCRKPRR